MTTLLETSPSGRVAGAFADPPERRAVGRMLQYWRLLAVAEGIPPRARVEFSGPAEMWASAFIVRVARDPSDYVFERAGSALADIFGDDPTAKRVGDVVPAQIRDRVLFFQKAAVVMRSPVDESGRWRADDGAPMRFRMIVLPLSDDQIHVDHLLGAFTAGPDGLR